MQPHDGCPHGIISPCCPLCVYTKSLPPLFHPLWLFLLKISRLGPRFSRETTVIRFHVCVVLSLDLIHIMYIFIIKRHINIAIIFVRQSLHTIEIDSLDNQSESSPHRPHFDSFRIAFFESPRDPGAPTGRTQDSRRQPVHLPCFADDGFPKSRILRDAESSVITKAAAYR